MPRRTTLNTRSISDAQATRQDQPQITRVVVFVSMATVFGRELVAGLRAFANELPAGNHWFTLVRSNVDDYAEQIALDQPDGVVVQVFNDQDAEKLDASGVKWVNVGGALPQRDAPWLVTDDAKVGRLAAQELIQRGLQHYMFLGNGLSFSDIREQSFREALAERSYTAEHMEFEQFLLTTSRELSEAMDQAVDKLRSLSLPMGVFCCNDAFASFMLEVCYRAGVRVPEDVALIGVDNDELLCDSVYPTLSSIQPDAERIGYAAGEALHGMLNGKDDVPRKTVVPPIGVIPRMSTDLLATTDEAVTRAMKFIQLNAANGISVDDVAQNVAISRRLLEIKFKQVLKQTPAHEIRRVRIERAMELLRSTDWAIARVADAAGFGNPGRFATTFREWVGESPKAFRERCRSRQ